MTRPAAAQRCLCDARYDGCPHDKRACTEAPGTPWSPYFCGGCDERRRAHISANLAEIGREALARPPVTRPAATRGIRGHGLQHEGAPVLAVDCCADDPANHLRRNHYDGHGHGLCRCGALSPHLMSTAARQRWHREHKTDVAGGPR